MASSDIHSRYTAMAAFLASSFALSACRGEGGAIASAPPPPVLSPQVVSRNYVVEKQLAPAPAWTTGTYAGIGIVRNLLNGEVAPAPDGTMSLTVDTAAKTYALTVSAGSVAVARAPFSTVQGGPNHWSVPYIGTSVKIVQNWSDGVARPAEDKILDVTEGGYHSPEVRLAGPKILESYLAVAGTPGRHVSLGYWSLSEAPLNADGTRGATDAWSEGSFAFGNRTAPSDIPASGTARYEVEPPEADGPIHSTVFDVDFAARTIAADLSRSLELGLYPDDVICCYGGEEFAPDPATRIGTLALVTNASGIARFAPAGSFDIALAGTGLVRTDRIDNTPVADISLPVSGSISGAFFGPRARELGGTYILPAVNPDGTVYRDSGAFTAVQSAP